MRKHNAANERVKRDYYRYLEGGETPPLAGDRLFAVERRNSLRPVEFSKLASDLATAAGRRAK